MSQTVIDMDAPITAAALPQIGLGELLHWAPIIEELIAAVATVKTTGATTVPVAKIRVHGEVLDIGPIPVSRELPLQVP